MDYTESVLPIHAQQQKQCGKSANKYSKLSPSNTFTSSIIVDSVNLISFILAVPSNV